MGLFSGDILDEYRLTRIETELNECRALNIGLKNQLRVLNTELDALKAHLGVVITHNQTVVSETHGKRANKKA